MNQKSKQMQCVHLGCAGTAQEMSLSTGVPKYTRLGIETPETEASSAREESLLQP